MIDLYFYLCDEYNRIYIYMLIIQEIPIVWINITFTLYRVFNK